jgi:hypothetical protein
MAWLDVSHLRMLWRHRPARSATSSREAHKHASGMECEPESRIIVIKKLCVRWRLHTTSIRFTKPQAVG